MGGGEKGGEEVRREGKTEVSLLYTRAHSHHV